nr:transglycosylase domain-containing protein [Clostridia bacterium]
MKNKKRKKLKKEKLEKLEIKNYDDTSIEEKRIRRKKESNKKKRNERKIDNQIDEKVQLDVDGKIEKRKARKRIFVLILIILVVLLMMFLVSLYKWNKILKDIIKCENSVVVDSTGNVIAVLGESRIQEYVKLENIPKNLVNAYVSIEDKNFYKHNGINVKRTAGAVASYVFNGGSSSFGGSTITQQLVKNITGDNETKISRKVQEWDRAIKTELVLSKDEILETYLNIIYVGPNIYGVEKGAEYYFNKKVSELDLAECAFLAGINNSPNSYNPFGKNDNSEKIKSRTTTVLNVMLEQGYISNESYDLAVSELQSGLKFNKGKLEPKGDAIYSYMVDATISEVINDLENKKGMSTNFATNYLYFSGLKIYSTQNSDIQREIEKECEKNKYMIKSAQYENTTAQAAMVVMNHNNGQVMGCVGGLGKKTISRGFNRATQALRQTGSAIKPIAVLGPALEEKIITPVTIYDDTKTVFAEGYSPDDCEKELGEITVRRAVESSQNIPFVKIMEQLTPEKSMKYMEKEGIANLTDGDKNLGLALGGLEKGSSPLEMASAYACIANGGNYIEPTFYTKVENSKGKIILKSKQKSRKVYSEDTAYVLKELLTEPVNGENGTARTCKIDGMEVAAKTGTTNDNYDKWLCGFTKYYTAVTWFGYDVNEPINEGANSMANQIWGNVMREIHRYLIKADFDKPKDVEEVVVCRKSGKVAESGCGEAYVEYFRKGTR